ncbi:endonuclease/exonuclease/phosphatase family protein, partial [Opisthorchis viverrini]
MTSENPAFNGYERDYCPLLPNVDSMSVAKLRFMQWNVLAHAFATVDQFIHCPTKFLPLENRCEQIVAEIFRFDPDLICLQEVDFLSRLLNRLNANSDKYAAAFSPKVQSPCLKIEDNIGPDGAAIIYRSDRLIALKTMELPLDNLHERSALLCRFQFDSSTKFPSFYVVSVHLKAKLSYVETRLEQGKFLRDGLVKLLSEHGNSDQRSPLFVCGDFNAQPHEPVIELMQQNVFSMTLGWNLTSAYAMANNGKEPDYTTWKIRHSSDEEQPTEIFHTIDYIFYSRDCVYLCGLWWPPLRETIGPTALPSSLFPSDHMNLVADFALPVLDNTEI